MTANRRCGCADGQNRRAAWGQDGTGADRKQPSAATPGNPAASRTDHENTALPRSLDSPARAKEPSSAMRERVKALTPQPQPNRPQSGRVNVVSDHAGRQNHIADIQALQSVEPEIARVGGKEPRHGPDRGAFGQITAQKPVVTVRAKIDHARVR